MVLTLSDAEMAEVLTYDHLIPAMERALADFSAGRVIQPVRNMITIEEGGGSSVLCRHLRRLERGPSSCASSPRMLAKEYQPILA